MNADTFGTWLKARRKKLDLTQEALANLVGCSVSAIRKIENDERRPSRQIAELLATHLEIPSEEQTLFLKIARGDGSVRYLNSASTSTENLLPVTESFFPASNIPAPTSPFIGRQQERESLAAMLADPRQRLITILGPGGIGKTRLALEAATAQLPAFEEHVYFIQLAAFDTSAFILPAIAAVFNLHSTSTDELLTSLTDSLLNKKVLLVLDNFEHLVDGALQVSELLQRIPHLKALVTSRERLNLQGEWTFELSGLSIPPKADEGKALYSALQLFELHTQRIRPGLKLVGKEREAAIRICQRVDGMPLAIELAAAWVNVLSCVEIADEIEQGFDFLSSTLRDVPERHRSLRATFEHSWKRLTTLERNALSGLSVFQGGFRFEAAEAVVGAERGVLSSLESKSLLRRSSNGRFDLHEVIRQYAKDYLKDESALRDRHSRHFLSLMQQEEPAPIGAESDVERLRKLSVEYGNVHLAWNHAVRQKMYEDIDKVLDNAWLIYAINGWFQEGIEQMLALAGSLRGKAKTRQEKLLLARALMSANGFLSRAGHFVEANRLFEEGTGILRGVGDISYLSNELIAHGKLACVMGDYPRAHQMLEEGIELAIQEKNDWMLGLGFVNFGFIFGQEGNYERAYELIQSGLSLYRQIENVHGVAFALNLLGPVLIQMGRLDEAHQALQESLMLNTQFHDRWGMGMAYGRLGLLSLHQNDLLNAGSLLKKSLALFNELGMRWDIAWVYLQLGKVTIASEDWQEAEEWLKRSIKLSLASQALPQAIDAALELADGFIHQGEFKRAMELILPAVHHSSSTGAGKQRAGDLRTKIEKKVKPSCIPVEPMETVLARFSA